MLVSRILIILFEIRLHAQAFQASPPQFLGSRSVLKRLHVPLNMVSDLWLAVSNGFKV